MLKNMARVLTVCVLNWRVPDYSIQLILLMRFLKMIIYNASAEKLAFEYNNPIIQTENPIIGENNPIIQNEKLTVEEMRCAIAKKSYNLPTQKNLLKVYDDLQV
ncbi:MAG: hypothetical protein ACI4DW_12650 [Lachnospiraceae bacterium]